MCNAHHSESGQLCRIQGCAEYLKIKSERDHLQGVVQGMTEQNERNVKALVTANQRLVEAAHERENLRQENATLNAAVDKLIKDREYFEQRNVTLTEHRDYLFEVVDNLVDDNDVYAKRNVALCQERDRLAAIVEKADNLPRHPQWTTYTGNEDTMPPILAAIIVEDGEAKFSCRHSADGECYQGEDDNYTLRVGAKWMLWPGGGE